MALIPCALLIASFLSPSLLIAQTTATFEKTTLSGPPTANHLEDVFFFDEDET